MSWRTRTSEHTPPRVGGDEFAAIVETIGEDAAHVAAQAVCDGIRNLEFLWEGVSHRIGVSIGVAPFTSGHVEVPSLMASADAACYRAKRRGRNAVEMAA